MSNGTTNAAKFTARMYGIGASDQATLAAAKRAIAKFRKMYRDTRASLPYPQTEIVTQTQTPRSRKATYTVVDHVTGEFRAENGWTLNPQEARVSHFGSAQHAAQLKTARGGIHRRCSVVALPGRIGEIVTIG